MKLTLALPLAILAAVLIRPVVAADEALVVPVWPGVPPGSEGLSTAESVRISDEGDHVITNVHRPSLTVYLPPADQATGAGVLICPGGAHIELWTDHEGHRVGRWLAAHGIAGFMLKYRLANARGSRYQVDVHSVADAQRAIQLIRSRAGEWRVDPARVGIIGFSAGGHLAGLAAQRALAGRQDAADPVLRHDSRPAFQALIYPGWAPSIHPTKDSPPAFLLIGDRDTLVAPGDVVDLYTRFRQAGVSAELHIYAGAGHGFGIRPTNRIPAGLWPDRMREWLAELGLLQPAGAATKQAD